MKTTTTYFLLLIFSIPAVFGFNEEEAMDRWSSAFEWYQSGRNYSDSGQTPLALGSYEEALRQLEKVAQDFPGYETKMINYRLKALRKEVDKIRSESSEEDLAIATEFTAFIKLMEQADDERFSSRRAKALDTLRKAQSNLSGIISRRPDGLTAAVEPQQQRLQQSIAWLEKLVGTTQSRAPLPLSWPAPITGRLIKGTTEFVTDTDLPASPEVLVSAGLFPGNS